MSGSLRKAVDEAIDEMGWLATADVALCELARTLADQIDTLADSGDDELISSISPLSGRLYTTLEALGGTPRSRGELDGSASEGGKLQGLRNARHAQRGSLKVV